MFLKKNNVFPMKEKIYEEAFTHSSLNKLFNYERLEFLGDIVLNSIVSEYLYKKSPQKNEGKPVSTKINYYWKKEFKHNRKKFNTRENNKTQSKNY